MKGRLGEMDKDQIVKIKGQEDEWYKEAIFIIRKDMASPNGYNDLQKEADIIIGNYAKRNGLKEKGQPKTKDHALNLILVSSLAILLICLYLL